MSELYSVRKDIFVPGSELFMGKKVPESMKAALQQKPAYLIGLYGEIE